MSIVQLFAILMATTALAAPGAQVAVSDAMISYLSSDFIEPALINSLQNLPIPDIREDVAGFSIHLFDMHTYDFDCSNCLSVGFAAGEGLQVSMAKTSIRVHVHFDFHGPFGGAGTCGLHADGATASALIVLGDSNGQPTVSAPNTAFNLGDLDISCSGASGAILNILSGIFKGDLTKAVNSLAVTALQDIVSDLNGVLSKLPLSIPLLNDFALLRLELAANFNVTSTYAGVSLLGDIVPASNPSTPMPFAPPSLPPFVETFASRYLELLLSEYSIETALYTLYLGDFLKAVVPHTVIPSSFPIQLNTSDVGLVAPALPKKYPNDWMQIDAHVSGPCTASITTATTNLSIPLAFDFQVLESPTSIITAFTLACPADMSLDLGLTPTGTASYNLTGKVAFVDCQLTVTNSTVGPVTAAPLTDLVDLVLQDVALPIINDILLQGIPLPQLPGIQLTNAELVNGNGFITMATDFTL